MTEIDYEHQGYEPVFSKDSRLIVVGLRKGRRPYDPNDDPMDGGDIDPLGDEIAALAEHIISH